MNIWNHNRRKAQQAARYDVAAELLAFLEQMKQQYAGVQKLPSCSKEEFVLMLIGVGLLRKVPGMRPTLSMDFDQLVENQGAVRTHCVRNYRQGELVGVRSAGVHNPWGIPAVCHFLGGQPLF
ncbi:MAG: hypothetical protein H9882_07150 [Candidatus Fournierella pullistercoris]|uniref:Uncharacterized protein n=1 Tax=Candidatus Allofournierella pullistercoris TaxID=2838597 RepID=A0A948WRS8_9FIRM|nr:hypothetical protein [Candidatus Fournierella pullistercoris]